MKIERKENGNGNKTKQISKVEEKRETMIR